MNTLTSNWIFVLTGVVPLSSSSNDPVCAVSHFDWLEVPLMIDGEVWLKSSCRQDCVIVSSVEFKVLEDFSGCSNSEGGVLLEFDSKAFHGKVWLKGFIRNRYILLQSSFQSGTSWGVQAPLLSSAFLNCADISSRRQSSDVELVCAGDSTEWSMLYSPSELLSLDLLDDEVVELLAFVLCHHFIRSSRELFTGRCLRRMLVFKKDFLAWLSSFS